MRGISQAMSDQSTTPALAHLEHHIEQWFMTTCGDVTGDQEICFLRMNFINISMKVRKPRGSYKEANHAPQVGLFCSQFTAQGVVSQYYRPRRGVPTLPSTSSKQLLRQRFTYFHIVQFSSVSRFSITALRFQDEQLFSQSEKKTIPFSMAIENVELMHECSPEHFSQKQ